MADESIEKQIAELRTTLAGLKSARDLMDLSVYEQVCQNIQGKIDHLVQINEGVDVPENTAITKALDEHSVQVNDTRTIQTNGGIYVEGNVNIEGGDYVQHDKTVINIHKQVIIVSNRLVKIIHPRAKKDLHKAGQTYLTFLYNQYCYLNMKGMGITDHVPLRLELLDLYIPLRVRLELPAAEKQPKPHLAGRELTEEEHGWLSKPIPVLDVLREHSGIVLLGDPGAGKSTFLKYLALKMALGKGETELYLGERLPVLVPLVAYANAIEKDDVPLDEFIATYFRKTCGSLPIKELLDKALSTGRALVLLDGLDEVKNLNLRSTVADRVVTFYNFHQPAGNKFILTSRIIGYRAVRLTANDLVETTLVDLGDDEINTFVDRWTITLEKHAQAAGSDQAKQEAAREKNELLVAIHHNPGVHKLATNPLLLTILSVMKRQRVSLPGRRVELYDQYVRILLSDWNRARSMTGRMVGPDLYADQVLRTLAPLAMWMYQVNPGMGVVKREDLRRKLEEIYTQRNDPDPASAASHFLEDLHEGTGLLLERGSGEYGFIHLTFEEYLAGVAIALQAQGNIDALLNTIHPLVPRPEWHEALLLSIGFIAIIQQLNRVAGQVIKTLANDRNNPESIILAGQAAVDLLDSQSDLDILKINQESLLAITESRTVSFPLRCQAGNVLAQLGDIRPEVTSTPKMEFCFVPEGSFLMGEKDSRPYEVTLPAYWIGRFPITRAQFAAFVKAGGYRKAAYWPEAQRIGLWTEEGFSGYFDEQKYRKIPRSYGDRFDLLNHPVVGISWYEALAFTLWLNEKGHELGWLPEGWAIRLPYETEWEKAARGGRLIPATALIRSLENLIFQAKPECIENYLPARDYPWGDSFSPEKVNTRESGLLSSNAVGCFRDGKSPYGCEDLAGNVYEWTLTIFQSNANDSPDGLGSGGDSGPMILRGGSWYHKRRNAQVSSRLWYHPNRLYDYLGFRVVVVPLYK